MLDMVACTDVSFDNCSPRYQQQQQQRSPQLEVNSCRRTTETAPASVGTTSSQFSELDRHACAATLMPSPEQQQSLLQPLPPAGKYQYNATYVTSNYASACLTSSGYGRRRRALKLRMKQRRSSRCVVCAEKASGMYFGAMVCLPCKVRPCRQYNVTMRQLFN